MFGAVVYSHVCLQEMRKDKSFLTLPTFDHVSIIDVVSISDIPSSWLTLLWSVSNELHKYYLIEIPLQFFFAGVVNDRSCIVFRHFCNYKIF